MCAKWLLHKNLFPSHRQLDVINRNQFFFIHKNGLMWTDNLSLSLASFASDTRSEFWIICCHPTTNQPYWLLLFHFYHPHTHFISYPRTKAPLLALARQDTERKKRENYDKGKLLEKSNVTSHESFSFFFQVLFSREFFSLNFFYIGEK